MTPSKGITILLLLFIYFYAGTVTILKDIGFLSLKEVAMVVMMATSSMDS